MMIRAFQGFSLAQKESFFMLKKFGGVKSYEWIARSEASAFE